jgi:hypothetical protein
VVEKGIIGKREPRRWRGTRGPIKSGPICAIYQRDLTQFAINIGIIT